MYDEKITDYNTLSYVPTKEQMLKLIDLLKNNMSVHTVELRNCEIDDDLALSLIAMVKVNNTIRRLDLSCNDQIGKEITGILIKTVEENKNISNFRIRQYRMQR